MTSSRLSGPTRRLVVTGPEPRTMGERFKVARWRRGWSLRAVEDRAGVSNALISQIENDRTQPGIMTAAKLAEAYGVSLEWLATGPRTAEPLTVGEGDKMTVLFGNRPTASRRHAGLPSEARPPKG